MKKIMLAVTALAIATFSISGVNAQAAKPAQTTQAPAKAEKKGEKAPKKEHAKKHAAKEAAKPAQK